MRKFILGFIIIIIGAGALIIWRWYRLGGLQTVVVQQISQRVSANASQASLMQKFLGLDKPQTYLILFLNNTEIRPAGGFIGAYGVVRINKLTPEILKIEGTELLDNSSPQDFLSVPPEPLQKYLPIKRWEFRDSNWSPDFAISAAKAIDLFKKEKGTAAEDIDTVIGITPTLLEEILKISGPILVNGQEFNAQNFTEKLEYEVEYGYAERGLDFNDRKKVLTDLTNALLTRIRGDIFKHWPQYLALSKRMISEKQILAYAIDPAAEKWFLENGWGGEIKQTASDYLLWVDANLASLKTDKVIDRELSYSFMPTSSGKYIATVKMKYINNGGFTKFTTRYRTYARVCLPMGSQFISAVGNSAVDQGIESGKQWFGAFTSIEPGKTGELVWQFYLAPQIVDQIQNNFYNLLAQKQSGTIASTLTLDLNFGKNIVSTKPNEATTDLGNQVYNYNEASGKSACDLSQANCNYMSTYNYKTDLRIDREFNINLK